MIPNGRLGFHHRSASFHDLLDKAEKTLRDAFGLHGYDLFFVTGCGTLVNEMAAYSLKDPLKISGRGKFTDRLKNQLVLYEKYSPVARGSAGVAYETPLCAYNSRPLVLADMVSAFPYYLPTAPIWTTVSGKQLNGLPGLGIIGIDKECWSLIKDETESVLSLRKWRRYKESHETPYTPAVSLLEDLIDRVSDFDLDAFRKKIKTRKRMLMPFGRGHGPVMNLVVSDEIAKKFGLYQTANGTSQVFLYAGEDQKYELLVRELEC